ncbi:hypothetical protein MPLB_390054 [Mesorhizobium sp. ORS 3324]|nr:hypothetical protein MPLB_390054 [Mesorhizobium sp. ORS 3324]
MSRYGFSGLRRVAALLAPPENDEDKASAQFSNPDLAFLHLPAMLRSQIAENGPEMPPDIPVSDLKK